MARRTQASAHNAQHEQQSLLLTGGVPAQNWFFSDIPVTVTAGIDEAGRGCLAGPVVAGAVIFPAGLCIEGLDDSKKVPESRRAGMAARIGAEALAWSIGVVWPREIDRINILQATFKAMSCAVLTLKVRPKALLIDGNQFIPEHFLHRPGVWDTGYPRQRTIVDGDALVPVISAASIIAKTFRDNLMEVFDRRYPAYGFAAHKGYGTREHLEALQRVGPCPLHRLTFAGVLPRVEHAPMKQGRLW